jgi:hypothetical protein
LPGQMHCETWEHISCCGRGDRCDGRQIVVHYRLGIYEGFSQVHHPFPCNELAMFWTRTPPLAPSVCRCNKSPRLVGQGSATDPYELEYADEVVVPSPNPSSYTTPPVKNEAPIPTPAPASVLDPSNKENCKCCPITPRVPFKPLVPVEEIEVDKAEDKPVEVCSTKRVQGSKHGRGHCMTASHPYHLAGGSDGDKSCGDEGRRFRYRIN